MSRPIESVPNQYSALGERSRRTGRSAFGSIGREQGAKIAIGRSAAAERRRSSPSDGGATGRAANPARTAATDALRRTDTRSSVADPRIEEGVADVDQQIDQHVADREHQHDALDHRIVAAQDRIDGQPADAGNGEHGLGHHTPLISSAMPRPIVVTIGTEAFLSAWPISTFVLLRPFDCAVRM